MGQNFFKGDLVWSEYYCRLGVVESICDSRDYSQENVGYNLCDPTNNKNMIAFGVREVLTNADGEFKLIKLANGYKSTMQESKMSKL